MDPGNWLAHLRASVSVAPFEVCASDRPTPTKGALLLPHHHEHISRVLLVLIFAMATTRPAAAQSASVLAVGAPGAESLMASTSSGASSDALELPVAVAPQPRSLTLSALQISFGALEVADVATTVRGLNAGLTEANTIMHGIAGRPIALASVKAGAAAATLILVNRMARRHRAAALVTMVALNVAYSVAVAHNIQALQGH